MTNFDQEITDRPVQPVKKNRKVWLIVSAVVLLILCLCVIAATAVIYFDPFNLGLIGRLFGGYDAVARAVPEDTDLHVSIDMLKFMAEDSRAIFDAFAGSTGNAEVTSREEMIDEIDASLLDTYGVTFSDDIMPWIGQYAGFSIMNFDIQEDTSLKNWVIALEARDRKAADAFILKAMQKLKLDNSTEYTVIPYEGADLYAMENISSPVVIGRHKNIIFISDATSNIQQAIDAGKSGSLADNETYRAAVKDLPVSRMVTAFLSESVFNQLTSLAGEMVLGGSAQAGSGQSSGVALSLVSAGIQMDFITVYDLDAMPQERIEELSLSGAKGLAAEQMPQDVILLLTGNDLGLGWDSLLDYLQQSAGMDADEIHESMQLLEGQIGFNPERDLFPLLDEEWVISLVHERGTLLAEQMDLPLGLVCIAGSSQTEQLANTIRQTAEKLSQTGMITVSEKSVGDMTLYEASIFMMGTPLFSFGTRQDQFLLSTNPARLEEMGEPNSALSDSSKWQDTWKSMPGGMSPILYLDVQSLMSVLPEMAATDAPYLAPILTAALAGSPLDGNTRHWVALLTIETE